MGVDGSKITMVGEPRDGRGLNARWSVGMGSMGVTGRPGMDMRPGQPDAGVVDGQHRSMSPVHAGRPDRIGSLLDDACPTAVTPDTGLTEDPTASHPKNAVFAATSAAPSTR